MMWQCARFSFDTRMPIIMGILNVTPDSFSDGGQHADFASAVAHARAMVEAGAQIIDVGGESTRPGSDEVSVEEELSRVLDVVAQLSDAGYCVSIDTRHPEVAARCIEAGAAIINDVSGFRDPAMVEVACACDAGLVVMHMKGEPATMQVDPTYDDVVAEVRDELAVRIGALTDAGVDAARIVLDPGLGFSKRAEHNWALLGGLDRLIDLGFPVLVGASRKRFLGAVVAPDADVEARDLPTAVVSALSALSGAWAVRVHDVRSTRTALDVARAWQSGGRDDRA